MNAHLFAQTPHPSFIFCDWARLSDAALPAPILILLLPSHCSRLGVVKVLRKTLQQANCHVLVCLAPIHLDLMISMKNRKITFTWLKKVSIFNTMCHHKELYKNYLPTFPPNSPPESVSLTCDACTFTFVNDIHRKFQAKYQVQA